jgi:ubiquinone/menaquinone biosynthesis C-methylase UbiE
LGHYALFDERDRKKWQNPEAVLMSIGLKPGFTFVDIGCGDGFFAIPAAKVVGQKGLVYRLDVDEDTINRLGERARWKGLLNLVLKVGKAEKTVLCDGCADIVFFGIVLHDFESVTKVLSNARRMLKLDGRLIDLDWKKEPMELGPPMRIRFRQDQATSLIVKAGFKTESTMEAGPYHYLITARP